MIWSSFKFKNQLIENDSINFWITIDDSVNPRWLESSDTNINISNYHWVLTSWTFSRWRLIVIEWHIESKTEDAKNWFWEAITYLDKLFVLQSNPSILQLNNFNFIDEEDNEWAMQCKIKTPIEYELFDSDSFQFLRRFRIVLFWPEWQFFSKDEIEQDGGVNWFSDWLNISNEWLAIPNKWVALKEGSEWFIFGWTTQWNQPVFPKVEITLLEDTFSFLKLMNNTTWDFIIITWDFNQWDLIIVDNLEETITQNGTNIIWLKSWWDFFEIWPDDFIEIYDSEDRYRWEKLEYTLFFKSVLL